MLFNFITRANLIEILCLLPLALFLSTFLHELSHLIVISLAKWKIISFKPYPHKYENEWVLGAVYFKHYNKNLNYLPAVYSSSLWKSYIFFTFWAILSLKHIPLIVFALFELCDYVNWWRSYIFRIPKSDGFKMWYLLYVMKKNK